MYDWLNLLLKKDNQISEAIEILNNEKPRIVLVVDENNKLIGTITDGDIRRALIKGCSLDSYVKDIMNSNPRTASTEENDPIINERMRKHNLMQMPILDKDLTLVGLKTLRSIGELKQYDNPVIIMAGGYGKRLLPLTEETPKPLLKVGTKPILETIIEQFINYGFHNIYISTHYRAEMLREHFGNGDNFGVKISYLHEEKSLGTAGSLGLLPKNLPDIPILLMNGDLLTSVNYVDLLDFHKVQKGLATACVRKFDMQVPFGVVETENFKINKITEKPVLNFFVNAGIYVIEPALANLLDGKSYMDMPFFLQNRIQQGDKINMFPIHEYWLDIGRMEEYEQAQIEIKKFF
jgi:dTDP-glucose pyrophosphorylase/predicted transcriptional regulator